MVIVSYERSKLRVEATPGPVHPVRLGGHGFDSSPEPDFTSLSQSLVVHLKPSLNQVRIQNFWEISLPHKNPIRWRFVELASAQLLQSKLRQLIAKPS